MPVILAYLQFADIRQGLVKNASQFLDFFDTLDVHNVTFVNLNKRRRIVQDDVGGCTPPQHLCLPVAAHHLPQFPVLIVPEIPYVVEG